MSIFLTGASGFLGGQFLSMLVRESQGPLFCLTRHKGTGSKSMSNSMVEVIQGGLFDRQVYAPFLQRCDTVVHMAAATGQGSPAEFFHINAEGTRVLLEECRKAGVKKVLFVSTIAVTFKNKNNYYYALSKERAETFVRESGIQFTIVRPTIIVGQEGKAWQGLAKFAKSPILLIPGDGLVQIQPIYVGDLVQCLVTILQKDLFQNETYEIGGPEIISMRGFLRNVYKAYHGKFPVITIPLPVRPIQGILSMVDSIFGEVLPVSAGQLSSFRNDGVATEPDLFLEERSHMKTVDEMIGLAVGSC